jgi:5'-methylthioinosine phosphorylase
MSAEPAPRVGLIGGTGLDHPEVLRGSLRRAVMTSWGEPSAELRIGWLAGVRVAFLPRHGDRHEWPPHRVNYRANLAALHALGVRVVVGLNAVGGIAPWMGPGRLAVPDQLIDYTWGRAHSFWDGPGEMRHVEFTSPMDEALRARLLAAAGDLPEPPRGRGTYGVTQGPRLETRAEIDRLARDGCDMVGMTLMPEAVLARELGLRYACVAMSVNWAAGRGQLGLHAEMEASLAAAGAAATALVTAALPGLAQLAGDSPPG